MVDDKTTIARPNGTAAHPQWQSTACLVQYSGTNLGKRYVLEHPETIIGRAPTVDIFVNDQSVSRSHAQCVQQGDEVVMVDLGSSNGIYINDQEVRDRQSLHDGDIVRLGNIVFKYFAHGNVENVFLDKIYRMATIDEGTGTFNKKYLLESLDNEFKLARASALPLSVIYFDLDFFKKVNDTYGHGVGDGILRETAAIVKSTIRATDIFCRFGGEEFVILLPGTDDKTAGEIAERIRGNFESHTFDIQGNLIRQTASLGVSQLGPEMPTPESLLEDADKKLYQSKSGGRNRVTN
ncbi:diguanylate cyclase [Rhodanobacter hydrolyticus]|uniref:diguanylate cyclase n=1 Tax=Rhodanobacter hydrolyticus TaxID=2250595 RepID=A0ABW8J4N9_9GAMM